MNTAGQLGEKRYQQDVLSALLKWTIAIGPPAALLNLLGNIADPSWTTPMGSGGVLLLTLIGWWCLRLVRQSNVQRAARIYVVSGLSIMAVVVFIGAKNEALLGAMGMCVFVVMATFFEPPHTALRWGALSGVLYEAGFFARSLDPSRDFGLHIDVLSLYIVPPIILLFLAIAGRIMNEHLANALAASEAAGRDLARSYAEVEQRVAERTHDLVKERYRLSTALRDLTEARDQAEAASRAKSAFLANMSHELRTPLTTILGYATLIERELEALSNPSLASDLNRISLAGNHLLALISDVLDLAEVEAGTIELRPAPFELAEVIDEALDTIGPLIVKNNNRLDVQYLITCGVVNLDRARVRQILVNLLSNAAKFTEGGTITLEVSREEATDAASPQPAQAQQEAQADSEQLSPRIARSSLIVFRVIDTGIGIAPDQISQLFHPFTQGDMAIKRMHGGTGLGLAICHRFCELMGGEIAVDSAEGQGTTFTVRLPAKASQYPVASSAISEADSAPSATATVTS